MILRKCGIDEFAENTKNSHIICFGASQKINAMCNIYFKYKLWRNIVAIADNNTEKHGTKKSLMWNPIDIISVDELVQMYNDNKSTVLLITTHYRNSVDVIEQLNEIPELDNMDCYIFEMFPFCDSLSEIPAEVLSIRSAEPQIPKVIHYIWIGGNPIPEANLKYIESWKKYCPDYEIKLWNEENYDFSKVKYMKEAYAAGKWSFATDYARLDILFEHGGVYLDTDVELLKGLDELLFYPAYFGMGSNSSVNTGLGFGAIKGHPLVKEMRDMYDDIPFVLPDGNYNYATTYNYQTVVLNWHGFTGGNRCAVVENAAIFPVEFFSPKTPHFGLIRLTDNCYSIHHFDNNSVKANIVDKDRENREFFESN